MRSPRPRWITHGLQSIHLEHFFDYDQDLHQELFC